MIYNFEDFFDRILYYGHDDVLKFQRFLILTNISYLHGDSHIILPRSSVSIISVFHSTIINF